MAYPPQAEASSVDVSVSDAPCTEQTTLGALDEPCDNGNLTPLSSPPLTSHNTSIVHIVHKRSVFAVASRDLQCLFIPPGFRSPQ